MRTPPRLVALALMLLTAALPARGEDGYELWLRYVPVADLDLRSHYLSFASVVDVPGESATLEAVRSELKRGLEGLLGVDPTAPAQATDRGLLVAGTPRSSSVVNGLGLEEDLAAAGDEGYVVRTAKVGGRNAVVVAANTDVGVLYGAFHVLRLMQTHQRLDALTIEAAPRVDLRILNHWDNLDRTVERGYAGFSLWDWHKLPDYLSPRYTDYARANASIGINGTVLTNVNANAFVLTPAYIEKAAALADVFRPYGIRVYLTARFSAPREIGGLATADPLDPDVRAWWAAKADEIYEAIPDFGGFLVKANSEGQPGPQDYGRTHAEGANMLAEAVAPHGGIVMWRAFVYSNEEPEDRAKQANNEFEPLDGQFLPNVLVQVKNGPVDFQPREPFHPLFGAMPETPLMMEFQITKEYLGQATHLTYLSPLWEEVLDADTYAYGEGSTVGEIIDGSLEGHGLTGMAGVANTGTDRNWCGSLFDCANWYAFGRLAWDHTAASVEIARDWIRMTFTNDPAFVEPVLGMMMGSREAVVNYMTPLGLHHVMARGHHYGPGPWVAGGPRADWTSVYYHRADSIGVGFDRTATGSNAVSQYKGPLPEIFGSLDRVPDEYLLWFHHVTWDHPMDSGRTLWHELIHRYNEGVAYVRQMRRTWASLDGLIDPERFAEVTAFLAIQEKEAVWWRDASLLYFQTFSGMPIPGEYEQPAHSLEYYQRIDHRYAPG
ncbi:MAG TPA: alpha-glucuronidase family glycosyl hydrolase [Rhodothermales bacterium]